MDAVATAKLALEKSSFENGLKEAENAVGKFAKQTAGILGGAFAFDKILSGLSTAIEKGDQLQDLANRFGISASSLQELGNAASLSGAGVEDVASAMNKLAVNAGKAIGGDTDMEAKFKNIGLSVEQLRGMSPQDIFYALSDAVASNTDPLDAFAKAQEVAGKAAIPLIETLRMGPAAIQESGQAMGVWGDETIENLAAASDEIKIFQNTMTRTFGAVASIINPAIKVFKALTEEMTLLAAAAWELAKGNVAGAKQLAKQAGEAGMDIERDKYKEKGAGKPVDVEGQAGGGEPSKAEKKAIKDRTDEAMRALKEEESEKKLAADSEERQRKIIFESEREAINEKIKQDQKNKEDEAAYQEELFQAEMKAAKFQREEAIRLMKLPRQMQQAEGGAAGQRLDIAAGLGGGVAAEVEKARKKAAEDQKKVTQGQLDKEVLANTAATKAGSFGIGTAQRSMSERRSEYIQTQAKKEAEGKTTLDDINKTLQDALSKLTSAPLVS
jgi:hypothetical protein